jgi:flagellar basal body-associated protein FliL
VNVQSAVVEIQEADKLQSGSNNKLCILAIIITIVVLVIVGGLTAYFVLNSKKQ